MVNAVLFDRALVFECFKDQLVSFVQSEQLTTTESVYLALWFIVLLAFHELLRG
jgi:hypothetical protein